MNNYNEVELMSIVAKLSEKYTSKESTSISYGTAKQLMNAVIYCIHEYELTIKRGIIADNSEISAEVYYEKGYNIVLHKTVQAKRKYNDFIDKFKSYGNIAYYDTIVKGMPAFFINYDAKFKPYDYILSLDYPILVQLEKYKGIDRIEKYLNCIIIEQQFLSYFPESFIQNVLKGYHRDCDELLINVSEILIHTIICNCLLEKDITNTFISQDELKYIKEMCNDAVDIDKKVRLLLNNLVSLHCDNNIKILKYISKCTESITSHLKNGIF